MAVQRKKYKNIKKGMLVEVYWLDAACTLDWDVKDINSWIKEGGSPARTLGYVEHIDDKGIVLPCEKFDDGVKRSITYIPMGMITKIRRLK